MPPPRGGDNVGRDRQRCSTQCDATGWGVCPGGWWAGPQCIRSHLWSTLRSSLGAVGSSACRAGPESHPWISKGVWEAKWAELTPEWMWGGQRWEATMMPPFGLNVRSGWWGHSLQQGHRMEAGGWGVCWAGGL